MDEFDCPIILNPERICRICMDTMDKVSLSDLFVKEIVDGELLTLPAVFQQIFCIKVIRNDKLPQKICNECKEMLIECAKFKRKCENSNKVLHDILQPGYDYNLTNSLQDNAKLDTNEASVQTDAQEIVVSIQNMDEQILDDIFVDGGLFFELKMKAHKVYNIMENKFRDLAYQYVFFDDKLENFCTVHGCEEQLSNVVALQSHMRENHSEVLKEFIEKLDMTENEIDNVEPESNIQYTINENNEVVQVEEYEEVHYNDETEEEIKPTSKVKVDDPRLEITNVSYQCPICHKLYQGEDEIDKHRILHEIVLPTIFDSLDYFCCEICKVVFASVDKLKLHYNLGHETIDSSKLGLDREFGSLPLISTKMFLFKEQSANTKDDSFLEMIESHETDYETPLICGICQKSYNSVISMKYHAFSHLNIFKCSFPECGEEFDFGYKLLTHMRYTHFRARNPELTCPHCKEQFGNRKDYGLHIKTTCTKRNISCELCGKKFVNIASLKIHIKTHIEHKCVECDEVYTTTSDFRNHLRRFHADDNKMYKCNQCDKRFRTPSHRDDHQHTHSTENKYQCEICMNFFKSERVMKSHQKLHTVGRSHACPVCGRLFNRNYHVKLHLKTHNKETN